MTADDWDSLREELILEAEQHALADPANEHLYMREAFDFCAQDPPLNADELHVRTALAETIRQKWQERSRASTGS